MTLYYRDSEQEAARQTGAGAVSHRTCFYIASGKNQREKGERKENVRGAQRTCYKRLCVFVCLSVCRFVCVYGFLHLREPSSARKGFGWNREKPCFGLVKR